MKKIAWMGLLFVMTIGLIFTLMGQSGSYSDFKDVEKSQGNVFQAGTWEDPKVIAFSFQGLTPAVIGVVNEGAHTVALTVPFGTNVTDLVPTIVITGASVNPLSGVANNFTTPQTYTVTSVIATTQDYIVTVTIAAPSTVATVTSGTYTVSAGGTATETITDVPFETAKATFLAALTKGETHQTWVDTGIADTVVTDNTLVVTAQDGTTVVTYTVTVNAAPVVLNSIAITTPATKLIYTVGDSLDLTGLVVTGTYSDSSTKVETITGANVTGFDSSAPVVDQVLTITVDGKTTTYTVDVVAVPVTLQSIAITTPATKLVYTVGDSLDLTGLVVTGTYSDSSTKVETITGANVTGFDSSAPVVDQVLTITVDGKTTTYTVDVVN